MAEEAQYSSDAGSNKRKYEEETTPATTRRPTGFSSGPIASASPPDSGSAPLSYNSVPPPPSADDVQAQVQNAKLRAQEIASRLLSNAAVGAGVGAGAGGGFDVKRARVENGSGFDFSEKDGKPMMNTPSAIPVSYNYGQGTSKKIDIPNGRVGVIIGKAGETIKYLQLQSGAKIQVTRDMDADPNSPTRMVELMGTPEQIAKAEQLINDVLAEAEAGGSGIVSRRITGQTGSEQFVMKVPNNKVGLVIGKGGETIKNMQARTGARIQVIPLHLPPGDPAIDRNLYIDGTTEQIEAAKQLVNEVISENRMRNTTMSGGYSQQGYQARPPTSWGAPGAPQIPQPGYGYAQPGMYPGPPPQYNMAQPQYGGYPPQPASGGYPSNWDQSAVPPSQHAAQGGGYDYYGQQTQQQQTPSGPSATADNSGYSYNQPPATAYPQQGQGYPQDGYGGYHAAAQSGYGQPPTYDQQQGYNTATGYGTNAGQDGQTSYGAQGDSAQAPPAVQPSPVGQQGYGSAQPSNPNLAGYPQGSSQSGYGMPPTSQAGYGNPPAAQSAYGQGYGQPQAQKPPANPPAYGGAQQSPSTPGGYGQAPSGQPGYPHSQPPPSSYSQPDSATRAPPSGYGAAPYGAPPAPQPGYGQPPPYGSYSGSYPPPAPAYTGDGGAAGGSARGTYDAAAPASQAAQQSAVAKTSPQS